MTAITDLRGPLFINIGKRKKGIDKPDSGLDWRGYNAAPHDGPDKGPDGRWKSGHGSVRALGDMPDFVGSLHDDDIKQAKMHARSLIQAIEAEEKRRAPAAKPKTAAKPIPVELSAKLEAVKKRPLPRDKKELETELKALTIAQLKTLPGGEGSSGTKAEKIREVIQMHTGMLQHEAITHGTHDRAGATAGEKVRRREAEEEFKRRKTIANERGDREEYAALVAGFGVAGTGPGLPPERGSRAEEQALINATHTPRSQRLGSDVRPAEMPPKKTISQSLFGDEPLMGSKADRINRLNEQIRNAPFGSEELKQLKRERDTLAAEVMGKPAPKAKPLKVSAKPNDGSALGSSWMDGTFAADIDAVVKNPKAGSAELLAGLLGRLKVAELGDVARKYDAKLLGRTKKEKIDNLVGSLVQNKLNSQAIRDQSNFVPKPAAKPIPGLAVLERKKARLQNKVDAAESASRESGRMTQSDAEVIARAELQAVDRQIRELKQGKPGTANLERLAGGPIRPGEFGSKAGPTYLSTPRQIHGNGAFGPGSFHPDGRMGTAWQSLTPQQASESIDGMRLDDALAETMRMGYDGQAGRWAQQAARFREIISKVKDPKVKKDLEYAFNRLETQPVHGLSHKELADAPEPLRRLMALLEVIPNTGQGGNEVARLADIMRRWSAGEMRVGMLDIEVDRLAGYRHESQEGHHEVARAVRNAADEIRALRRDLKRPGSGGDPKA